MAHVEEERKTAQQELIALHKQAADDKRVAVADTDALRHAAEEREGRVQVWHLGTSFIFLVQQHGTWHYWLLAHMGFCFLDTLSDVAMCTLIAHQDLYSSMYNGDMNTV